jgi:hypothetical protein
MIYTDSRIYGAEVRKRVEIQASLSFTTHLGEVVIIASVT